MSDIKYGYTQATHCDVAKYTCLMPVEYQKSNGKYTKVRMACSHVENEECDKETSCRHFIEAEESIEVFLLKDKRM